MWVEGCPAPPGCTRHRGSCRILDLIKRTASARVGNDGLGLVRAVKPSASRTALRLRGLAARPPKPEGLSCAMHDPATLRIRFDPTLSEGSRRNLHRVVHTDEFAQPLGSPAPCAARSPSPCATASARPRPRTGSPCRCGDTRNRRARPGRARPGCDSRTSPIS